MTSTGYGQKSYQIAEALVELIREREADDKVYTRAELTAKLNKRLDFPVSYSTVNYVIAQRPGVFVLKDGLVYVLPGAMLLDREQMLQSRRGSVIVGKLEAREKELAKLTELRDNEGLLESANILLQSMIKAVTIEFDNRALELIQVTAHIKVSERSEAIRKLNIVKEHVRYELAKILLSDESPVDYLTSDKWTDKMAEDFIGQYLNAFDPPGSPNE